MKRLDERASVEAPADDGLSDTDEDLDRKDSGDTSQGSGGFSPTNRFSRANSRDASELVSPKDLSSGKRYESSQGKLTRFVRKLVSKKKNRIQDMGYDLDMTYITDRIIAMGYPTSDSSFQSNYRNPFSEVKSFLDQYHKDAYRVYNLCAEKKYDAAKFDGRAVYFPFADHMCPHFQLVINFCEDAKAWLDQHPSHVIAVHCKAGKGRTGLMISCLLSYAYPQHFADDKAALDFYGKRRTSDGKGVTLPSQRRYVYYFEMYLRNYLSTSIPWETTPHTVRFLSVEMSSVPRFDSDKGCDPYFIAKLSDGRQIYSSKDVFKPQHFTPNKKNPAIEIKLQQFPLVKGDVCLTIFDKDALSSDEKMAYFWINTVFIPRDGRLTLARTEIEKAHKDKKFKHFDKDWTLTLTYEFVDDSGHALSASVPEPPPKPAPPAAGIAAYVFPGDEEEEDEEHAH
jgi:phosphatidylinositol-3,4,5-trisphosphate 3-phosphatase/dual-specificity protein phosphatase PTEN